MSLKTIHLTDTQHLALDQFDDAQSLLDSKRAKYLAACLMDNGGNLNEGWQFQRDTRIFWRDVPDAADNSGT